MTFANAKYITLTDKQGPIFTGGLITNSEPWMIPYKNTPDAHDFRVNGRGIYIRPGFTQYGVDFVGTGVPFGIGNYYRSTIAADRIIVGYKSDGTHYLVSIDPATGNQTNIVTGAFVTSMNRMNFISTNDSLYCMNGVDLMGKLNGTTYTNPVITYKPSFGAFFDNSLWISGDPAIPNAIYKSAENNPESYSGAGTDLFTAEFPITGLASAGQTLYIFTANTVDMINNNSIKQIGSSLSYTSIPLEANEGAINHNCVAVYGKDCFYLSKSLKIKQVVPNGMLYYDVKEVSHRANRGINSVMDNLDPDQSNAFCYVIPEKQIIKWHLKSKGSTYNDICVIYSPEYDEFMLDTQKIFFGGVNYRTQNFTIGQAEPKFYKDEYGQTDDDAPIPFRYTSKFLDLGEPTQHKEIWQTRTYIQVNTNAVGLTQTIIMDGNVIDTRILTDADIPNITGGIGTAPIGTYAVGTGGGTEVPYNLSIVREKGNLQQRGNYFQVVWTCNTLAAQILLQQFTPKLEMLNQLTSSTI